MTNTYKPTTKLWIVEDTGDLEGGGCTVTRIIFIPVAADNVFQLTDTDDNLAIPMKAGAGDASPVHLDLTREFGGGRRLPSLKCGTITAGTAYVMLRKEDY